MYSNHTGLVCPVVLQTMMRVMPMRVVAMMKGSRGRVHCGKSRVRSGNATGEGGC